MEHISSSAAVGGTPVQYGKWTFLDISHTIKESAPLSAGDQDKLTRYDPTPQERKASWVRGVGGGGMARAPRRAGATGAPPPPRAPPIRRPLRRGAPAA